MPPSSYTDDDKEKGYVTDAEGDQLAPDESVIVDRFARYGKVGAFIRFMLASGVEARGVERVPEDERETKNMWNKYVLLPSPRPILLNECLLAS